MVNNSGAANFLQCIVRFFLIYFWYSFLTPFCNSLSLKIWNISMSTCTCLPSRKEKWCRNVCNYVFYLPDVAAGCEITTVQKLQTTLFCCVDQTRCVASPFFTPRLALRCSSQIVLSLTVSHPGYMKGKRTQSSPPDSWRLGRFLSGGHAVGRHTPRHHAADTNTPSVCLHPGDLMSCLTMRVCVCVSSEVSQMDVSIWQSLTL